MLDKFLLTWYNAGHRWERFLYQHSTIDDMIYATRLIVSIIIVCLLIVYGIAMLATALAEPTCADFAKAFTGNYKNTLWSGCFIELPDHKYYYYKNIIITPKG